MGRLLPLAVGCVVSAACGESSIHLPRISVRAEMPEGEPPPHLTELFDHYASSVFLYDPVSCRFMPPDREPGDGLEFRCGELHVGVRQGIEAADLSELLAEIDGTVLKDRTSWSFPRRVIGKGSRPRHPEGTRCLRVFRQGTTRRRSHSGHRARSPWSDEEMLVDARVRYADPSWTHGGLPG